ncbi:unnamed protein product [Prorocentrum cordatum]|uniref:Uncharacterized protein n=1 Tax=Prorocentrum cordatum TaxID=2364126 RepID=A0ABN9UQV7_9DINO|nr:unnamed protein product [Polarella glacialis]
MIACRDLAGLRPELVRKRGFSLHSNYFLGKSARLELDECAGTALPDRERLQSVHDKILQQFVNAHLWAPSGWTVSHTEDLLCEKKRWTDRRDKNQGRKRDKGGVARMADSQARRQARLRSMWRVLGFRKRVCAPDIFSDVGVAKARRMR